MNRFLTAIITTTLLLPLASYAERILVVGDSITGHSMNLSDGYTHRVRQALKEAAVNDVEFIPLGGSGQSVTSWQNVIKTSKNKNEKLDIKGIFVKEEFDKGTDTLIILLGMNDALAPYTDLSELKRWKNNYQKLIDSLKERVKFKKLILASPTMLTETPYSYKNSLMDEMAKIIKELAKENNAEYAPVREEFKKFHENARKLNTNRQFTRDYVHPNSLGHQVMAFSLLNAIGQHNAAEKFRKEKMDPAIKDFSKPGLSLYVQNSKIPGTITIKGRVRGEEIKNLKVQPPDGLKLDQVKENGDEFTITLKGEVRKLQNTLTVSAGTLKQTVALNAPFLICTGIDNQRWFKPSEFNSEKATTQIDLDAKAGKDVAKSMRNGKKTEWIVYFPTSDVTGGNNPDAVDFASVTNGKPFESGYLLRYIHSPDERKVNLTLGAPSFAGQEQITVYLNGKEVYSDVVTTKKGRKDTVPVELKKGWNTLIARISHVTWQWTANVGFKNMDGSDCSVLTYSITGK